MKDKDIFDPELPNGIDFMKNGTKERIINKCMEKMTLSEDSMLVLSCEAEHMNKRKSVLRPIFVTAAACLMLAGGAFGNSLLADKSIRCKEAPADSDRYVGDYSANVDDYFTGDYSADDTQHKQVISLDSVICGTSLMLNNSGFELNIPKDFSSADYNDGTYSIIRPNGTRVFFRCNLLEYGDYADDTILSQSLRSVFFDDGGSIEDGSARQLEICGNCFTLEKGTMKSGGSERNDITFVMCSGSFAHSDPTCGTAPAMWIAWSSSDDPETIRFLEDAVIETANSARLVELSS